MSNIYSHDFAICPWCGGHSGHRVDHLYDVGNVSGGGPWYCAACRRPFNVRIGGFRDVTSERAAQNGKFARSLVLLRFDTKDGPVFFIMDHDRYQSGGGESDEANQETQRYFFEEYSCPTNWLRDCVAVIKDQDTDPHGFLTFVRAVDVPQDFDVYDDENWWKLFPEAFGTEIDLGVNPTSTRIGDTSDT